MELGATQNRKGLGFFGSGQASIVRNDQNTKKVWKAQKKTHLIHIFKLFKIFALTKLVSIFHFRRIAPIFKSSRNSVLIFFK